MPVMWMLIMASTCVANVGAKVYATSPCVMKGGRSPRLPCIALAGIALRINAISVGDQARPQEQERQLET
eukprot:scaffold65217_cov18-Prasinocladus_malaysianus.AAC.1